MHASWFSRSGLLKLRQTFLEPNFRVCGIEFSNFRRRKRCNFSRRIRQAPASGRVRRCAFEKIAFGNCARLHFVVRCFQIAEIRFSKRIAAFAASIFQIFGAENAAIFRAKFADRARSALRIRTIAGGGCDRVRLVVCCV